MADGIRATPYRSSFAGSANDILGGLLGYMRDPRRTQQMQGLAGLLESTGIPKTVERLAYGEPLTNLQKANVPTLRPETAEALMMLLPVPSGANRAAMAAGRAGERLAERVVPQVMERGGMPAGLLEGMSSRTVSPLTVYHGSPAKFERFDPTKIGSGEGAQAYGYGHYVAESPGVAKDYQRRLAKESQATDLNTKMKLVDVGGKPLTSFDVDMDSALIDAAKAGKTEFVNLAESKKARWEELSQDQSYPFQDYAKQKVGAYNSLLDTAKKSDVDYTGTGMFYEIDLPDEQIAKMLDWDKPLSKQPNVMAALNNVAENNVKAKIRNDIENEIRMSGMLPVDNTGDDYMSLLFGQSEETIAKANQMLKQLADEQMAKIDFAPLIKNEIEGMKPATMTWDATGKDFYEMLAKRRGSPENASSMFKEQGIPGIRYLDQGSRNPGGSNTSNFVVFPGNEDLLTILKRNEGLLGP